MLGGPSYPPDGATERGKVTAGGAHDEKSDGEQDPCRARDMVRARCAQDGRTGDIVSIRGA